MILVENPDIIVWLLFAPFWLLGIAALVGAVWHFIHFAIVHAQAAGHVLRSGGPQSSFFSRRLQWHELSDDGRHHLERALIAIGAFIGLCIGGILVGVVAALLVRV
jgi:hypothetical protein